MKIINELLNNIIYKTSYPFLVLDVENKIVVFHNQYAQAIFPITINSNEFPPISQYINDIDLTKNFNNKIFNIIDKNGNNLKCICNFELLETENSMGVFSIVNYELPSGKFPDTYDQFLDNEVKKRTSDLSNINQRLQESEERYRCLFDGSSEGILVVDDETKNVKFSNSTFLRILAYKRLDITDKNLLEFFPEYASDYVSIQICNDKLDNNNGNYIPSVPFLRGDQSIGYANISFSTITFDNAKSIMCIFTDITIQLQKEKALLRFNNAFKMSTDAIILTDNMGHISDLNYAACQLFNLNSIDYVLEKRVSEIIPGVNKTELGKLIGGSLESITHNFFEWNVVDENGIIKPIELSISSMSDNENNIGFMIIGRDISDRKKYERELEKSLQEKELLLKEIHHRVKNNLQVISSILSLQSRYVHDEAVIDMLDESQNRVKSMSIIHESLCNSEDIAHIDMNNYIDKLNSYMQHSYPQFNTKIIKQITSNNSTLDLQKATSCGIIINELVSNSLKYAFNEEDESIITVNFTREKNDCVLSIKDNGRGLPHDIDFERTKSFGLRLVRILTNQLNGKVTIVNKNGTEFQIQFPAN
ncbi:MAG: PAS domain S-box protein [Melioribacteraceae bacterium]|nr:PAS domain S-box protein [Melioribacteraceae bacterium]